jgi:hypothetical protein
MITRRRFSAALPGSLSGCASSPSRLAQVSLGRVERLADLGSRFVDACHVDVWLPPGCNAERPCRALCMHDGQALFDGAMSMSRKGWHVDAGLGALIEQRAVPAASGTPGCAGTASTSRTSSCPSCPSRCAACSSPRLSTAGRGPTPTCA